MAALNQSLRDLRKKTSAGLRYENKLIGIMTKDELFLYQRGELKDLSGLKRRLEERDRKNAETRAARELSKRVTEVAMSAPVVPAKRGRKPKSQEQQPVQQQQQEYEEEELSRQPSRAPEPEVLNVRQRLQGNISLDEAVQALRKK